MKTVIIGGGPGGYVAAIRAAQLGSEVVLVEKDKLGGTCLNRGCIPTKALLHAAELYEQAISGEEYGINATVKVDFSKVQKKKDAIVAQLVAGITGLMKVNKIEVISAQAEFIDKNSLRLISTDGKTQTLSADRYIIATGSRPAKPPIPGLDLSQCIDSTQALELSSVPKNMVIIGGGVIGVEMATVYSALGCSVVIVEMMSEILPMMDGELAKMVRKALEAKGVEVFTGAKVLSVEESGKSATVNIELGDASGDAAGDAAGSASGDTTGSHADNSAKELKKLKADKVLISIGRKVNTDGLGLEAAGVATERGRIITDSKQMTNVPNIFAIGDCSSKIMLAHVASVQGEVAAENALGGDARFDSSTNPSCVYTNPEFAGVGLTEEMAKEQGLDYMVGRFPLAANGKSLIMMTDGMVKIIAGKKYGEVLGVHIVGPRATDMIAEAALAIRLEATLDELIDTIHAHPTVSEAVRESALAACGRAVHIPNIG